MSPLRLSPRRAPHWPGAAPLLVTLLLTGGVRPVPAAAPPPSSVQVATSPTALDPVRLGALREETRLWLKAAAERAWEARLTGRDIPPAGLPALLERGTIDFVRAQAEATPDRAARRPIRLLELELVAQSAREAGPVGADQEKRVVELGYQDYVEFSQVYRGVFLPPLMRDAMAFVRQTDSLYTGLLGEASRAVLRRPAAQLHLADFRSLEDSPDLAAFFPAELAAPAFLEFLRGLGLEMTDLNGRPIREDRTPGAGPGPRVYAVEVPSDVRLWAPPLGGLAGFRGYFREAGRALALARTSETTWEYRQLGGGALREGVARLMESAWTDAGWLRRYREFVRAQNGLRGGNWPLMSEADIARAVRRGVFLDLLEFRRGAQARLIVECIDHEAPREYVIPYYAEAGTDVPGAWRTLLGFALGITLTPGEMGDAPAALTPFLASADEARGWVLMATLVAGLTRDFGSDWVRQPSAGRFIVESLMAPGTRLSLLEAAAAAGFKKFDFDPLYDRVAALGGTPAR